MKIQLILTLLLCCLLSNMVFGQTATVPCSDKELDSLTTLSLYYSGPMLNMSKTKPYAWKRVEKAKKLCDDHSQQYIKALQTLRGCYTDPDSLTKFKELNDILEKIVSPKDTINYADLLVAKAIISLFSGDFQAADSLSRVAMNLLGASHNQADNNYIGALSNRILVMMLSGNPLMDSLVQKLYSLESIAQRQIMYITIMGIAETLNILNQREKTDELLAFAERFERKDSVDYCFGLSAKGRIASIRHEYKRADTLLNQSKSCFATFDIVDANDPFIKVIDDMLCNVYIRLCKSDSLSNCVTNYKSKLDTPLGRWSITTVGQLMSLGHMYRTLGRYADADTCFRKCLNWGLETRNKKIESAALESIMMNQAAKGDLNKACETAIEYIKLGREIIKASNQFLTDNEMRGLWAEYGGAWGWLERIVLRADSTTKNQWAGQLYDNRLESQTFTLDYTATIYSAIRKQKESDPSVLTDFEALKSLQSKIAKYYQLRKMPQSDIQKAKSQADSLQRRLLSKYPNIAQVLKQQTWKNVQAALDKGEAAVEIIAYVSLKNYNCVQISTSDSTVRYAALIVTPQSKVPQVVDLPDLHPYGDADKWAKVMEEKAEQLNDSESPYIAFWKPIAEFLKKQAVKTVYLSGDHIYSQVNLDAMFVESVNRIENGKHIQEQKYVADYWRIILVNSTAKIAEIKARPKTDFAAAAKRGQSATLVGRPKYGPKTIFKDNCSNANRRGEVSEGTLEDLPCTEKEIMQTETLLKSKGINSIILLRDKATEGAIKKIKSPFMLLLATHGDYRSLKNAALIPLLETTLPYFRIYFTGASDTTGNREEDGILTGLEIQSMELDSTELVFLSSCNSGQGYVAVGDLAYNLPRAFAIAGARQVLTTLRPIGDEDAAVFVETFYKNWIELGDASLAFRATQFELRKKNSHPKTWGAFVLIQN